MPGLGRRRLWLLALLVAVACTLIALHHYSRPQRLTDLALARLEAEYGLKLALPQPASIRFLPVLQVELERPVVTADVATAPLLAAERVALRVPWSTLLGSPRAIDSIELDRPRIDTDALQQWLASRDRSDEAAVIPAFRLRVRDATVTRGNQSIATALSMELSHAGELDAWLKSWSSRSAQASPVPPLSGRIEASTVEVGDTRLEGVRVRIDEAAGVENPEP